MPGANNRTVNVRLHAFGVLLNSLHLKKSLIEKLIAIINEIPNGALLMYADKIENSMDYLHARWGFIHDGAHWAEILQEDDSEWIDELVETLNESFGYYEDTEYVLDDLKKPVPNMRIHVSSRDFNRVRELFNLRAQCFYTYVNMMSLFNMRTMLHNLDEIQRIEDELSTLEKIDIYNAIHEVDTTRLPQLFIQFNNNMVARFNLMGLNFV